MQINLKHYDTNNKSDAFKHPSTLLHCIVACPRDDLIEDINDRIVMQFIISSLLEKCRRNLLTNIWERGRREVDLLCPTETEGKSFCPVS